jgi:hypothetical protein
VVDEGRGEIGEIEFTRTLSHMDIVSDRKAPTRSRSFSSTVQTRRGSLWHVSAIADCTRPVDVEAPRIKSTRNQIRRASWSMFLPWFGC